ncbi:MAG: metal-dependent transcriptional regulator [Candidatus Omnitrophica bacterium]|nr:metal-dependent transcriptional regulator [Candidatus Omnitrophota bacterium]
MHLTDRMEEILETLWIELMEHKHKSCDMSLLRDDESIGQLEKNGFVKTKESKITLTRKGEEESKNCVRRHRLAERLFVDIFDIKKQKAHDPSCKFEHLLHKGLDESVCALLGHPKRCPHGKPIPEGKCCKRAWSAPKKVIMRLSDLKPKQKAMISYLHTNDKDALQKLIAMGALPKADIRLLQKFPSIVFQIGKSQFAVDKELASNIYVRLL